MPTPLRNAALCAMELANLAGMFPGRLIAGLGHGIQEWMGQAGARVASPLTLLEEYVTAVRRLLAGDATTTDAGWGGTEISGTGCPGLVTGTCWVRC